MIIREATPDDHADVWNICKRIIDQGETYVFDEKLTKDEFVQLWFGPARKAFVATVNGVLVGTYVVKPNQPGRGSHIANGSYLVKEDHQGMGIGDALCKHSIQQARQMKYVGLQFNIVVSSNDAAIRLWKRNGFKIIGTTPNGFRHKTLGLVDTHIMFLALQP